VEVAAIDGIRQEFEANLVQIDELLAEHSDADADLVAFFDAPTPQSEADAESAVGDLIAGLLVGDLLDPSTGTLEMLLNSGRLHLLSDPELQALLWTWKTRRQGCRRTCETTDFLSADSVLGASTAAFAPLSASNSTRLVRAKSCRHRLRRYLSLEAAISANSRH